MVEVRLAGIELGGTKCIASLASADGTILEQETLPTLAPEQTLPPLAALLANWRSAGPLAAIGVASFGPVELDPAAPNHGHITSTSKPGWRDTDVLGALRAGHDGPWGFDTDVNAAAVAEGRWGAAQGLADYAYVTVGTGVGVGLIVNGLPTRGLAHCELGHIRVARRSGDAWPGACPYHGDCVEGLASGPAIKARLGERAIHAIASDDPVWDEVAHPLAQMCHTMLLTTAPRRILFGGGVIQGQPQLIGMIHAALRESVAGYMTVPEAADFCCAPGLGDKAGPLGPVALALAALDHHAQAGARVAA